MSQVENTPGRILRLGLRLGASTAMVAGGSICASELYGAIGRLVNEGDAWTPGFVPKAVTGMIIGGIGYSTSIRLEAKRNAQINENTIYTSQQE